MKIFWGRNFLRGAQIALAIILWACGVIILSVGMLAEAIINWFGRKNEGN
jgi:hypothetical protein